MDLLNHILAPFVFIIEQVFLFSFRLTGNYGISVVLLSFIVSLLLLPVFILIERAKKRDDAVKRKMKPVLDEIKRCYKGQERYYYIRTLHRQHGYNSFRALVPVLTLLLQIPFFIAAYQFLEHYEPLVGQGFLLIDDLSAPDRLLGKVNLLPILMTIVNLVTAWFYTRNGDTGERRQMLVVAGVFLVLLYNFPSGLVLYWTMNNVFSFFRLFITNPEVFRRPIFKLQAGSYGVLSGFYRSFAVYRKQIRLILPKLKVLFIVLLLLAVASQLNWAIQNNFNDIVLRMIVAPVASLLITVLAASGYITYTMLRPSADGTPVKQNLQLVILFLAIYFYFAAKYYFTGQNKTLLFIAVTLSLVLQFISVGHFKRARAGLASAGLAWRRYNLAAATILLLHLFQVVNLLSLLNRNLSINLLNLQFSTESSPWLAISAIGIVISLLTIPFYLQRDWIKRIPPPGQHWLLFSLAILYITGLVFFWNPMIVYSSYPTNFSFPAINFLTSNFLLFSLITGGGILLYIFVPKDVKHIFLKAALAVTAIVFLYSSIIPFDAGTLQIYFLSNEQNLAKGSFYYIVEVMLLLGVVYGINRLLKNQKTKLLIIGLAIMHVLLIGRSLYLAIGTGAFFTKEVVESGTAGNDHGEIPFSRDKENIILFVIDGAQGWYMQDLLEEDSTLKEVYSGFTYFPNTLAMANYTYASVPSIMCGYDYSIANMNLDQEKTIVEKVTDATELFYKKIREDGFDFTSTILRYSRIDQNKFDNYIPAWHDEWSEKLGLAKTEEMWYTRLWENALFSSVPLFLKPRIYNDTKWLMKEKSNLNLSELNEYNFVRVLPKISNTQYQHPNFIYIHSLYTHNPWSLINDQDQFIRDVTPYACQRAFTYTFAEWLRWMKDNNVYDNTKIILVSDHGPSWWHYKGEITTNAPIIWTEEEKISLERF
ncbi:MAG: membrane protein insertase YidC, partial [Bacteroidales bacterium]|nr:membrane protein insertase YidC [Bacteroidales bacterium]